ncbi:polyserase-2 [Heterocephalus glaber]|uniref:Polyserase-2 n=1 Tax=Heterocephalus glaber TaxID=10181 RepID=A0AAX6R7D1_HETGA|nr:polyserase-2 [Heterocephalus glaber]
MRVCRVGREVCIHKIESREAPGAQASDVRTRCPAVERLPLEPAVPGAGDLGPSWTQRLLRGLPPSPSLLPAAGPWPVDQPCDPGSLPGGPASLGPGSRGEDTEPQTCPPQSEHTRGGLQSPRAALGGLLLSLACGLRPEAAPARALWPWLAEVHVAGDRVCTRILVAPGWVLAATHGILRPGSTTVPYVEVYLGRPGASPVPQSHQRFRLVTSICLSRHLGLGPPALLELSSGLEP